MNTISNIRWLELQQYRRRRALSLGTAFALALALWAGIIAAVVALT